MEWWGRTVCPGRPCRPAWCTPASHSALCRSSTACTLRPLHPTRLTGSIRSGRPCTARRSWVCSPCSPRDTGPSGTHSCCTARTCSAQTRSQHMPYSGRIQLHSRTGPCNPHTPAGPHPRRYRHCIPDSTCTCQPGTPSRTAGTPRRSSRCTRTACTAPSGTSCCRRCTQCPDCTRTHASGTCRPRQRSWLRTTCRNSICYWCLPWPRHPWPHGTCQVHTARTPGGSASS